MNRFAIASALTVAAALAFAGSADAQYVYGYQTYVPGTGVVIGSQTAVSPFGAQTTSGYYSPFTGLAARQSYYTDAFGNQAARVSGYNPYTNFGYRNGYSFTPYSFYGPSVGRCGYFYRR